MKFNHTKGRDARYVVSLYAWNVEDYHYFYYFREAKKLFDELCGQPQEKGTVVHITDISKDVRKEFKKF